MTFTIVAFDARSGALGAASGAVAAINARCLALGQGGVGIVVSQGASPARPEPATLSALVAGADPRDLLRSMLNRKPPPPLRGRAGEGGDITPETDAARTPGDEQQIAIVDARGRTAAHSGRACRRLFAHTEGTDHVAMGDDLPTPNVVGAMSLSFERSAGDPLWERLLLALESGARAGGDNGGARSAILVVYADGARPAIDLRVDDHDDPIAELRRLR